MAHSGLEVVPVGQVGQVGQVPHGDQVAQGMEVELHQVGGLQNLAAVVHNPAGGLQNQVGGLQNQAGGRHSLAGVLQNQVGEPQNLAEGLHNLVEGVQNQRGLPFLDSKVVLVVCLDLEI